MKRIYFLFLFLSLAILSIGQSVYSITQTDKSAVSAESASFNNAWIGSTLSGTVGNSGNLSDNILLSGKAIYNITAGKVFLPVVSNVNLNFNDVTNFAFGDKGISIGVYPYKIVSSKDDKTLVIHGGLAYKFLPLQDNTIKPQQTRIIAGAEYAFRVKDNTYPFTISVTPVYEFNKDVAGIGNVFLLETTAVYPISGGLGLLGEVVSPFGSGRSTFLRFGLIVNKKL